MGWWKKADGPKTGDKNEQTLQHDAWWPFDELEKPPLPPLPNLNEILPRMHGESMLAPARTPVFYDETPVDTASAGAAIEDEPAPAAPHDTWESAGESEDMSETDQPVDIEPDDATDAVLVDDEINESTKDETHMADYQTALDEALQIDGALGVALVETATGMSLGTAGNPPIDLGVAAAGNSSVVQAKLRTMRELGINEALEDILITLETQYHIIRTLGSEDGVFLYLVLDKERSNLAMARFKLAKIEKELSL